MMGSKPPEISTKLKYLPTLVHELISIQIAVMGAGQQWATFMRPGSTLLSIGWSKWKNDYYAKYARVRIWDGARVFSLG